MRERPGLNSSNTSSKMIAPSTIITATMISGGIARPVGSTSCTGSFTQYAYLFSVDGFSKLPNHGSFCRNRPIMGSYQRTPTLTKPPVRVSWSSLALDNKKEGRQNRRPHSPYCSSLIAHSTSLVATNETLYVAKAHFNIYRLLFLSFRYTLRAWLRIRSSLLHPDRKMRARLYFYSFISMQD